MAGFLSGFSCKSSAFTTAPRTVHLTVDVKYDEYIQENRQVAVFHAFAAAYGGVKPEDVGTIVIATYQDEKQETFQILAYTS